MKKAAQVISQTTQKGFTLIELLVVIGILGILAAALVATIDPFEQLQKATDSRRQNMAVEFLNSNIRYFTTHQAFPWNDGQTAFANCLDLTDGGVSTEFAGTELSDVNMADCIEAIINDGELKDSFDTNTNDLDNVYVTWDDNFPTDVTVCYEPVSRSQKNAPETLYNSDGTDNSANCPDPDAPAGTCFWCTR